MTAGLAIGLVALTVPALFWAATVGHWLTSGLKVKSISSVTVPPRTVERTN